jgi:hypothetical protein
MNDVSGDSIRIEMGVDIEEFHCRSQSKSATGCKPQASG